MRQNFIEINRMSSTTKIVTLAEMKPGNVDKIDNAEKESLNYTINKKQQ